MGNGVGKLSLCFAGDAGAVSRRKNDIAVYLCDPLDEGYGHSFCYFHHDSSRLSSADSITPAVAAATFKSISGASLSANTSTPLSTAPIYLRPYHAASFDKPSSFVSSDSFAAIPLQPIPRNSIPSVHSSPILGTSGAVSVPGQIGRAFLSGPIGRSFISGPLENQYDHHLQRYKPKSKKLDLIKNLKKAITNSIVLPIRGVGSTKDSDWANGLEKNNESGTVTTVSSQASLADDSEESFENPNVQWAQGKSGEDRVHIVISEEHDWVFVGIYDGFNGPDATDYLLNNLYSNVQKELRGLLWNENSESAPNFAKTEHISRNSGSVGVDHPDVLKALSEALKKTEDSFLEITDVMLMENPELSLMGSCVLVMLLKGEDVYLMNVGDSRAVLARKDELDFGIGKLSQDLERINEENSNGDEFDNLPNLTSLQLTVDHNTSTEEEVKKIKKEHPDDASAIANDRVKGSLKVTRAFGAGFLKQPKWNNALLEMFRIDYTGSSPYITCSPSLYHHRLGPTDRFLILSSDGLYQYFTNEEAISQIERFVSSFPEGDPAQHLVEQVLFRAAKKAGMDFHELLDIQQGDRRRYHDDVSVIIISFEGRLWRSASV